MAKEDYKKLGNYLPILQYLASKKSYNSDGGVPKGATIHEITENAFNKRKRDQDIKDAVAHLVNRGLVKEVVKVGKSVIYSITDKGFGLYNEHVKAVLDKFGLFD